VARHPLLRKLVVSTPVVRDLAWRYIAGEHLDAGLNAVRTLNARGIKGTLNFVGTHVRSEPEAIIAADAAIEALGRIYRDGVDSHLSIKPTQIGLDISAEFCRTQLRRVLEVANRYGNFVRIDMEESPYVDATLGLFEEMRAEFGADTVGIVIQSYLRNREHDLDKLIADGARVRLVKGGYWESPAIVYQKKTDIDGAFGRDGVKLLEAGRMPALASHDADFIAAMCRTADAIGLDRGSFEFQMLYGVRPDLQELLVRDGYTVRCYVPYGGQWYAYFLGCVRRSVGDFMDRFTRGKRGGRQLGAAAQPDRAPVLRA
jgi:proline dehydrogenase